MFKHTRVLAFTFEQKPSFSCQTLQPFFLCVHIVLSSITTKCVVIILTLFWSLGITQFCFLLFSPLSNILSTYRLCRQNSWDQPTIIQFMCIRRLNCYILPGELSISCWSWWADSCPTFRAFWKQFTLKVRTKITTLWWWAWMIRNSLRLHADFWKLHPQ